jgi:hypothetical protein
VHNDPGAAVLIAGLLCDGDVAYLDALRVRTGELLVGQLAAIGRDRAKGLQNSIVSSLTPASVLTLSE